MSLKSIDENEETPELPPFLLLYFRPLKKELLAIFGFIVIIFAFRYKAILNINSMVLGGFERDAGLYVWLIKANIRDLFSLPLFNTTAFYPYTRTLGWSDNFILPSLVLWPALKLGLPLVLAYNLLLLGTTFLNGFFSYRLCFRLSGKAFPAFIAGAAFMSLSALSSQLGHPQLQFAFFFPLGLGALFYTLSRPAFFRAYLLGVVVLAAFLTTVYYSLFLVVCYFSIFLIFIVLRPKHYTAKDYSIIAIGSALGVAPLLFFLKPYLDVRDIFGARNIYEAYYFSANLFSYISTSPLNLLYKGTAEWTHAEAYLFPGFTVLILSLLALMRISEAKELRKILGIFAVCFIFAILCTIHARSNLYYSYMSATLFWLSLFAFIVLIYKMGQFERRLGFTIMTNRGLIAALIFTAFLFFAISFGPLGNPEKGELALGIFRPFYELLPGFNSIRAISRTGLVCLFILCTLLVFGVSIMQARVRKGRLLSVFVLALILLENYNSTYPLQPVSRGSSVFEQLEQLTIKNAALMILPFTDELKANGTVKSWGKFAEYNVNYMNWAFPLDMPLVNGYSGQRSKIMLEYPRKMSNFPDRRSVNAIGLIPGLKYIIYVSQNDPQFNELQFLEKLKNYTAELQLISTDLEGNYLIEFIGKTRITEGFYLRTPSFPNGVLTLELQALYEAEDKEYELVLIEHDHFNGAPVATTKIKANGEWEQYSFLLPEVKNTARPLRISFKWEGQSDLLLKERSFSADKSLVRTD